MKKYLILPAVVIAALLVWCYGGVLVIWFAALFEDENTAQTTVNTEYGDTLHLTAKITQDLHDAYLNYEVIGESIDAMVYISYKDVYEMPADPFESFEHIANVDGVHIYKLQKETICVIESRLISFADTYSLDDYRNDSSYAGESFSYKYPAIEAIFKTGRLDYVSQFAEIMLYFENDAAIDLIGRWKIGDFSQEEIEINQKIGVQQAQLKEWVTSVS